MSGAEGEPYKARVRVTATWDPDAFMRDCTLPGITIVGSLVEPAGLLNELCVATANRLVVERIQDSEVAPDVR